MEEGLQMSAPGPSGEISFVVGAAAFALAGDGHVFIGETDTITDLAAGFLGAALGGLILAGWAVGRYTTRRVPRALREKATG
jgi:hypothetical protein